MQRRYTEVKTIPEAILIMAEGNYQAEECLKQMLKNGISGTLDILLMDSLKIYGEKIAMLWEKCENDPERLHEVMDTYREKWFTKASVS